MPWVQPKKKGREGRKKEGRKEGGKKGEEGKQEGRKEESQLIFPYSQFITFVCVCVCVSFFAFSCLF